MMLKKQQSHLLSLIFSQQIQPKSDDNNVAIESACDMRLNQQGLQIYQQSLLANATRALTITFATSASLIGEVLFRDLVKSYLQRQFKNQYDWGEWGEKFATFISNSHVANSRLLADIAALDFACHQCERAKNQILDLASMQLLANTDAYQLSIILSSGARLLKSRFPLDEIISEIKSISAFNKSYSLKNITKLITCMSAKYGDNFVQKDRQSSTENLAKEYYFIVWRPEFQAQYKQIDLGEYQWLSLWLMKTSSKTLSIGQALDEMSSKNFSIIDWLPKAIEQQLLSAIKLRH